MSEITGYISVPFHGEKGKSAYEIAVKYGYCGTEEEWLNSLGFIPDKSIGEEKLTEELTGKLREYEELIGEFFDEKTEYKECTMNEYTAEAEEYVIPWCKVGVYNTFAVAVFKIPSNITVFDESDSSLWYTAAANARLAKVDVSSMVGKSVRIYGRSQTASNYPLAFCVSEDGTILGRYGTEDYTIYGYTAESAVPNHTTAEPFEATIPEGAKYIYIQGGYIASGGTILIDAMPKIEITVESYRAGEDYKRMQSPLWGKKLYVDGDSICYGNGYTGGFGKIIADRYNMELTNNAVGGAYITNNAYYLDVAHDKLDWNNNDVYYLRLSYYDLSTENYESIITLPLTEEIYNNGFGEYLEVYRMADGVLEKDETDYSTAMPTGKWYVKLKVPTYEGNTVDKYLAMWAYPNADGTYNTPETTGSRWLWEAYKSGFASAHQNGYCRIGTARHWLCDSVEKVDTDADYIIFEGGINDYLGNRPLGSLTEDMTTEVDTTTVTGAMERICRYLMTNCTGKKILYVITHKAKDYAHKKNNYPLDNITLTDYHDAIISVLKKYSIPCVDLFNESAFCTELEAHLGYTVNNDGVHPNKDGYELFYVPHIVSKLERI